MSEFTTVAKVGDIEEGKGMAYNVNGRTVAIFLENGEYSAIDDLCPHMGASLAAGYLEDGTVACPWHAWRFCTKDGAWCDNPRIAVDCFEVNVEGDCIQVKVPTPEERLAEEPAGEESQSEEAAGKEGESSSESGEQNVDDDESSVDS
ncbi:MAG: nitrite reductase (NADH) small subunit [Pirellulaceae bacterium]|jgi:nitrite reductase (NADH) small subunit